MNSLKPAEVFKFFAEINRIPRPSKKEERMIAYLEQFARERGLECKVDETGNVLTCVQTMDALERVENPHRINERSTRKS